MELLFIIFVVWFIWFGYEFLKVANRIATSLSQMINYSKEEEEEEKNKNLDELCRDFRKKLDKSKQD